MSRPAASLLAGAAVVLAAALVALTLNQSASSAAGAPQGFPLVPESTSARIEPVSFRVPSVLSVAHPPHRPSSTIAVVRRSLSLRSRPGGPVDAQIAPQTEFGTARVLGVAARRGRWLGLVTSARPNGRLAWVDRHDPALRLRHTGWSLHADLSGRSIELRHFGRMVRTVRVAIGRPGSPTPTGRFAVTDKLDGGRFGPYYGCCILALSGYQEHLPAGWRGGNRIAIHGTDAPATIGAAASAGCLRAGDADLTALMHRVPLGTPVFIRS